MAENIKVSAEETKEYISELSAVDVRRIAEELYRISEAQGKNPSQVPLNTMYMNTPGEKGQWNEKESIGMPMTDSFGRPHFAVLQGKEAEGLGFKLPENGYYLLVSVPKDNAVARMYTEAKDMTGKIVDTTKSLGNAAVHKTMEGIECTSMIAAIMKEAAENAAKNTVDRVNTALDQTGQAIHKTVGDGKARGEQAYENAKKQYEEFRNRSAQEFEAKKKSLFNSLTRNMVAAKLKVQEVVMRKVRPFIRARDAVRAAVRAGKASWQASRPQEKSLSLKPKGTIKEVTRQNEK